jgi:hypothetical protein
VLSTPPAFVLSQNQTLQTKTTFAKAKKEFESEKSDQATSQNWQIKNKPHPTTGRRGVPHHRQQKNNKQKPPNTLLSSQTTHPTSLAGRATNPAAFAAC